ncbi:MAG: hypothetical protein HQL25_09090 [Candidatus Omnitrophica bacterium]|nr:hypothetical protein [Candidatus Omnitrophota bacterium]
MIKINNFILAKMIKLFVLTAFGLNTIAGFCPAYGQTVSALPASGVMLSPTPNYTPLLIKGIKIFPADPLRFDIIFDTGEASIKNDPERRLGAEGFQFKQDSKRLISYFLAALTIPENDLWVNLSPKEKNRIIPKAFGKTEMGRDLLSQDYILKQLTASLMSPDSEWGKKFWDEIYSKIYKKGKGSVGARYFVPEDISSNILSKVWIVPESAEVVVDKDTAWIQTAKLKVMTEMEYLAGGNPVKSLRDHGTSGSQTLIKTIIIPELEREVNEGSHFIQLRQIYHSLILAKWYKGRGLLKYYIDQNKIVGIDIADKNEKQKIYQKYLEAFNKGLFNFIREEYDPQTQQVIPRKYFSGGAIMKFAAGSYSEKPRTDATSLSKVGSLVKEQISLNPENIDNDSAMVSEGYVSLRRTIVEHNVEQFRSEEFFYMLNKDESEREDGIIAGYTDRDGKIISWLPDKRIKERIGFGDCFEFHVKIHYLKNGKGFAKIGEPIFDGGNRPRLWAGRNLLLSIAETNRSLVKKGINEEFETIITDPNHFEKSFSLYFAFLNYLRGRGGNAHEIEKAYVVFDPDTLKTFGPFKDIEGAKKYMKVNRRLFELHIDDKDTIAFPIEINETGSTVMEKDPPLLLLGAIRQYNLGIKRIFDAFDTFVKDRNPITWNDMFMAKYEELMSNDFEKFIKLESSKNQRKSFITIFLWVDETGKILSFNNLATKALPNPVLGIRQIKVKVKIIDDGRETRRYRVVKGELDDFKGKQAVLEALKKASKFYYYNLRKNAALLPAEEKFIKAMIMSMAERRKNPEAGLKMPKTREVLNAQEIEEYWDAWYDYLEALKKYSQDTSLYYRVYNDLIRATRSKTDSDSSNKPWNTIRSLRVKYALEKLHEESKIERLEFIMQQGTADLEEDAEKLIKENIALISKAGNIERELVRNIGASVPTLGYGVISSEGEIVSFEFVSAGAKALVFRKLKDGYYEFDVRYKVYDNGNIELIGRVFAPEKNSFIAQSILEDSLMWIEGELHGFGAWNINDESVDEAEEEPAQFEESEPWSIESERDEEYQGIGAEAIFDSEVQKLLNFVQDNVIGEGQIMVRVRKTDGFIVEDGIERWFQAGEGEDYLLDTLSFVLNVDGRGFLALNLGLTSKLYEPSRKIESSKNLDLIISQYNNRLSNIFGMDQEEKDDAMYSAVAQNKKRKVGGVDLSLPSIKLKEKSSIINSNLSLDTANVPQVDIFGFTFSIIKIISVETPNKIFE